MLITTGTIAYDYIMDFPGSFGDHILPNQIHNINLSFIVNTFAKRRGGTAGNVSYTLSLLTTDNILFSVAGKDFDEYEKVFATMGIDTSHVEKDSEHYTATGFAMTDKTDNQIWGYYYGAAEGIEHLQLATIAKKGDVVLVGPSGSKGSMSLVKQCVALGIEYMFDPGFILTQITNEDLLFGVEHANYLIGNDYEIALIKEKIPKSSLFAKKAVITTFGNQGAHIDTKDGTIIISAVKPTKIVDPTGAGDAWRAGFLAGLSRSFDMKTCGQMGSVAASFSLEAYGTQEHTFSITTYQEKYRQAFGNLIKLNK